jgi:hypothetical protein
MTDLRRLARYVIIEVRATGEVADAFGLAEFADAAIVVVEISSTRKTDAARCAGRLDRMRTIILGSAVIPAIRRSVTPPPIAAPKRPVARRPESGVTPEAAREEPRRPRKVAASSAMPGPGDQHD